MDVKSTFLNGSLEREVFLKKLPGFMKKKSEDKVEESIIRSKIVIKSME